MTRRPFHSPSAMRAGGAALLLLAAACSPAERAPAGLRPGALERDIKVKITRAAATLMVRTPSAPAGERGGTTLQLDADLTNPVGHELPNKQHTTWATRDAAVATVDSAALVSAVGVGETWLIAEHKGSLDSLLVRVVPVPVASVVVTGPATFHVDDAARYEAATLDSAGVPLVGRTVAWSSSAPAVASVSAAGEALGLGVGETTIAAAAEGKVGTLAVTVTPQPVATVEIVPAALGMPQYHRRHVTAIARDKNGKALAGRPITWANAAPAVAAFKAGTDTLVAADVGSTTLTATAEGKSASATVTVTNPVEARALWVTRFEYTTSSAVDFAKIATIMQKAGSARFNVVYFQVRTAGDALYFSDLEPCSPRMCGTLGGPRPAQDPLAVAIAEGAKHGIEVHAWLNAYTGWISGSTVACNQFVTSTPANWLKTNPQWSVSTKSFATGAITRQVDNCLGTSEYMWVSPGVPQVRAQLAAVSADIARRYGPLGLKGIHLDRIRYSSNQVTYDPATQQAFFDATGAFPTSNAQASWLEFRRGTVNQGVREVYDAVRAVNPQLVVSAAVFPGYKKEGSFASWSAQWSHSDLFQDPQAWAQGGYLDVELPMNYPATAASTSWTVKAYCSNTDWTCVMDDHIRRIERGAGRHVYVGVGAIKGWAEVESQLALARDRVATGVSVYSFSQVDAIPNGWALLAAGPFRHKATIPAMAWK